MATLTRTVDYLPYFGEGKYKAASALAAKEIRATIFSGSDSCHFRVHGSDSFTYGDQDYWIRSIIVNKITSLRPDPFSDISKGKVAQIAESIIVNNMVVEKFGQFPEIESIYLDQQDIVSTYYLFLNNDHNDRELMFGLFDIELEVFNAYPDRYDFFHYLPIAMGASPDADIPETAKVVFARG